MKFRLTAKWTGKLEIILCFPIFYYEELSKAHPLLPQGEVSLKGWRAGIDNQSFAPKLAPPAEY